MVADGFQHRDDLVVVGDCLLAFAFDLVSDLAGFHHFIDLLFDEVGAVGDVFDDLQVAGRKGGSLIGREEVFHLVDVVDQGSLVSGGGRDDVVHRQVTEYASFDLDFLRIGFPFDFVTGFQFLACHDAGGFEHPDAAFFQIVIEDHRHACLAVQATTGCFGFPFVTVAVAVKMDRLAFLDVFT